MGTLRTDAVLVDPETQAHVRVEHEVSDSTTANASVLVAVAVGKLNQGNAKNRRDLQSSDCIRGTRLDVEEHVKQSKVNECDLDSRKTIQPDSNGQPVGAGCRWWHEHTCIAAVPRRWVSD